MSQDDPVCKKTLEVFCGILGNFAGNLCLTLGATGGIYVGGGVIQKIDEAGAFERERFLDRLALKGRLSGGSGTSRVSTEVTVRWTYRVRRGPRS